MMNKILLPIIAMVLFSGIQAQSLTTKIERIEINGKAVKKAYEVFFRSNDKWIKANKTNNVFYIPQSLEADETLSVLFVFGKNRLEFTNIPISKFKETWVVGIDTKPFSSEFVSADEKRLMKRVYYIQFLGKYEVTQLVVKERKS